MFDGIVPVLPSFQQIPELDRLVGLVMVHRAKVQADRTKQNGCTNGKQK
jgi:hypothetical protein